MRQHPGNLEDTKLMLMTMLSEMGVSAEDYAVFLKTSIDEHPLKEFLPIESCPDNNFDDEDKDDYYTPSRRRRNIIEYVNEILAEIPDEWHTM